MGVARMIVPVRNTFGALTERHYLGPTKTALFAWQDEFGCMVFGNPRSRRLPADWLELVRWCLYGEPNAGSRQWASFHRYARAHCKATTVVSYSDPSQGHTGALYRACNWLWAPTWHRLRPPPSGNGSWIDGEQQATKDRWVFPLAADDRRVAALSLNDESLRRKMPWAEYREPGGGDFKRFANGHVGVPAPAAANETCVNASSHRASTDKREALQCRSVKAEEDFRL